MNAKERTTNALIKWITLATGCIAMFWLGVYFELGEVETTHAIKEWPRWFDMALGIILPAIFIPTLMNKRTSRPKAIREILKGGIWGALAGITAIILAHSLPLAGDRQTMVLQAPVGQSAPAITATTGPADATQVVPVSSEHPIKMMVISWVAVLTLAMLVSVARKRPWRLARETLSSQAIGAWFGLACVAGLFYGLPLGLEMAFLAAAGAVIYCHWGYFISEFRPVPESGYTQLDSESNLPTGDNPSSAI